MPSDALETPTAEREAALMAALPGLVARRARTAPMPSCWLAWTRTSRAGAGRLPVVRKKRAAGAPRQRRPARPFGGFSAIGWRGLGRRAAQRVFQPPGPIYEPEGGGATTGAGALSTPRVSAPATWCTTPSSYHLTPAGSMMDETGAPPVGCTGVPRRRGNTELQLGHADLQPDAYAGTPSFLRILLEKAAETRPRCPITKAHVGARPFPPLRDWLGEARHQGYQCYATADAGPDRLRDHGARGLVLDEGVIVEIVRPAPATRCPTARSGEVVVTVLNPDYPLVRFGTGDPSAVLPGPAPPAAPTRASAAGWAAPTRRPRCGHVRPPEPGGRGAQAPPRGCPRPPGGRRRDGQRPHDAEGRGRHPAPKAGRSPAGRIRARRDQLRGDISWCRPAARPTTAR